MAGRLRRRRQYPSAAVFPCARAHGPDGGQGCWVPRYAIRSARFCASFRPAYGMMVFGTTVCGLMRYRSSVAASQVRPDSLFAGEYLKLAICPACRPTTPYRLGPMMFLPSTEWQLAHCVLNTTRPAAASWAQADPTAAHTAVDTTAASRRCLMCFLN